MAMNTPGPWVDAGIEEPDVTHERAIVAPSNGYHVALVQPAGDVDQAPDLTAANARLIAAAPELLDGCNALLGLLQLIENRCDAELLDIIRTNHRVAEAKAAVAKATGEST